MTDNDTYTVQPCPMIGGTLTMPGDKSISHRVAMLAGLADGESFVEGFLASEDCLNTLRAVEQLGAFVDRDGSKVRIVGTGGVFTTPDAPLDLGNSGTGMRLLAGLLAAQGFDAEMTGDASLCSRPMRRISQPLEDMGATIALTGEKGCAPMRIQGGALAGIRYALPVASAQVKSCVLLAGLFAGGSTTVVEPMPTRDHTELLLSAMDAKIRIDGPAVTVEGSGGDPVLLAPGVWRIPGDFSSAAFWLVAAACCPGAELIIEHVGLNPRRTALLNLLRRMGADIKQLSIDDGNGGWELSGSLRVRGKKLKGVEVGGEDIPNLIDELPLVAVAGALADGQTVIRDAAELRVKESDRIAVMCENLRRLSVDVEEQPDGMLIRGGAAIPGDIAVDSRGDHRIAMAMTILGLFADGPTTVSGTACVATSYPEFWDDLLIACKG